MGDSAEKGDLSISNIARKPLRHLPGHIHHVNIPNTGPGGQQLLLFQFNDCRGWNMGLHQEHLFATQPCGVKFCDNAVQRYSTCTYQSHVSTSLIYHRHGKPLRATTPVPQSDQSSWSTCGNHFPRYRPCRYFDSTVLPRNPSMGLKIPHMAADFDTPFDDSSICLGMVSRRTLKKIDESPPWNWIGNIRLGDIPIFGGLVGSPQGEE